eukprot:scaffold77041_cov51-Cyclotella_meneghiniana.AAC.9
MLSQDSSSRIEVDCDLALVLISLYCSTVLVVDGAHGKYNDGANAAENFLISALNYYLWHFIIWLAQRGLARAGDALERGSGPPSQTAKTTAMAMNDWRQREWQWRWRCSMGGNTMEAAKQQLWQQKQLMAARQVGITKKGWRANKLLGWFSCCYYLELFGVW